MALPTIVLGNALKPSPHYLAGPEADGTTVIRVVPPAKPHVRKPLAPRAQTPAAVARPAATHKATPVAPRRVVATPAPAPQPVPVPVPAPAPVPVPAPVAAAPTEVRTVLGVAPVEQPNDDNEDKDDKHGDDEHDDGDNDGHDQDD
jgi:hypothetical protein